MFGLGDLRGLSQAKSFYDSVEWESQDGSITLGFSGWSWAKLKLVFGGDFPSQTSSGYEMHLSFLPKKHSCAGHGVTCWSWLDNPGRRWVVRNLGASWSSLTENSRSGFSLSLVVALNVLS